MDHRHHQWRIPWELECCHLRVAPPTILRRSKDGVKADDGSLIAHSKVWCGLPSGRHLSSLGGPLTS